MLLLGSTPTSAHRTACLYLLAAPLVAPPLQAFAGGGGPVAANLCRACLCAGNAAALLLLAPASMQGTAAVFWSASSSSLSASSPQAPPQAAYYGPTSLWAPAAHGLAAAALCLGCAQLLLMLPKDHVLRVMACTAAAVMVAALALAAAFAPAAFARRFFQAAALPFVLLFMETTRRVAHPPSRSESAGGA